MVLSLPMRRRLFTISAAVSWAMLLSVIGLSLPPRRFWGLPDSRIQMLPQGETVTRSRCGST